MKRFYKTVSCRNAGQGFEICLDDKPIRSDAGEPLRVPTGALAETLVREWVKQEDRVKPDTMPLTQLVKTACDVVARQRPSMEEKILAYLDTDLICYRAERPEGVVVRQAEKWDPWLSWFENKFGAALETTRAVAALEQAESAHKAVKGAVQDYDDFYFTALQLVTSVSGSLVLALAFMDREIDPDDLFETMFVEELYKAEIYNEDEHGFAPHVERQHNAVKADLEAAAAFLKALEAE